MSVACSAGRFVRVTRCVPSVGSVMKMGEMTLNDTDCDSCVAAKACLNNMRIISFSYPLGEDVIEYGILSAYMRVHSHCFDNNPHKICLNSKHIRVTSGNIHC